MSERILIATSSAGTKNLAPGEEDCGFSGVVPPNEVWTVAYWRSSGTTETDIGVEGQNVTVTRCHKAYHHLGICNGKAFFWMRKYRIGEENIGYDCLNGACVKQSEYNTHGLYQSLSECEKSCGTGCGGKCISNQEWSAIKGLTGYLKNQNCK